jgi:transglutaminase-like putative cysteine protease
MVRLYTRKANDWTERLPAIAAAAARLKAASFTIDGEAVVACPDGLTRFDDLRRRDNARAAFLYAFDRLKLRPVAFVIHWASLFISLCRQAGIPLSAHLAGRSAAEPEAPAKIRRVRTRRAYNGHDAAPRRSPPLSGVYRSRGGTRETPHSPASARHGKRHQAASARYS